MQQQATLLVNPRKGHEEYTKYSFPSKTMEYMASGTPTIMYKLPGLPIEYEEYLVLLPDNSQETLTAILKQCLYFIIKSRCIIRIQRVNTSCKICFFTKTFC